MFLKKSMYVLKTTAAECILLSEDTKHFSTLWLNNVWGFRASSLQSQAFWIPHDVSIDQYLAMSMHLQEVFLQHFITQGVIPL